METGSEKGTPPSGSLSEEGDSSRLTVEAPWGLAVGEGRCTGSERFESMTDSVRGWRFVPV
jgi:hypothetical protein